jgi:hypothetical protein
MFIDPPGTGTAFQIDDLSFDTDQEGIEGGDCDAGR